MKAYILLLALGVNTLLAEEYRTQQDATDPRLIWGYEEDLDLGNEIVFDGFQFRSDHAKYSVGLVFKFGAKPIPKPPMLMFAAAEGVIEEDPERFYTPAQQLALSKETSDLMRKMAEERMHPFKRYFWNWEFRGGRTTANLAGALLGGSVIGKELYDQFTGDGTLSDASEVTARALIAAAEAKMSDNRPQFSNLENVELTNAPVGDFRNLKNVSVTFKDDDLLLEEGDL